MEILAGTGSFTGPVEAVDGLFRRTLRAPSEKGFAVIEISVDGKPYAVRPRVWFD